MRTEEKKNSCVKTVTADENAMKQKSSVSMILDEYLILTLATAVLVIGVYLFMFPNYFSFGGVMGLAVLLQKFIPLSASTLTLIMNLLLLIVGFLFVGRDFGVKTVYITVLSSVGLELMDRFVEISQPLTSEPLLELIFAIVLSAVSAAIFFYYDASGGGTDIVAMIVKKYSNIDIGIALILVDMIVAVGSLLIYGPQTGLFSLCGLIAKSLIIDKVIDSMNLCKYLTIVCTDPEPICDFIHNKLRRSSTVFQAEGSYSHNEKTVVLTVMKRNQAIQLRNFVNQLEKDAFIMVTNSSEIIGNGFRGFQ